MLNERHKNMNKKFLKNNSQQISTKKGFALLIGVLVAGILLSITLVMFSISLKNTTLSTIGKSSQTALYSADTALECAYYWDTKYVDPVDPDQGVFAKVVGLTVTQSNVNSITCLGETVTAFTRTTGITSDGYPSVITTFGLDTDNVHAIVTVTKWADTSAGVVKTKIESRGHNLPNDELDNPQAVERGLEVHYP